MVMQSIELLRTRADAIGFGGHEDEVRGIISGLVTPLVDEVRTDALGNLLAVRHGKAGGPRLLIDAHMDEIGFMVSYIEDNGFVRFAPIGGWDARIIPSHTLTIVADDGSRVKGVIGTIPPHVIPPAEREKPYRLEDLFVDTGATSADEVRARGVRIGSPAVISYPFEQYSDQVVAGKAFDDRAGCAVLVKTLEALQGEQLDATVIAAFVVREETGLVGATTAAYQAEADVALVLEGTICTDIPGVPPARQPTRMGHGPAVTVADGGQVVPVKMVRALTRFADDDGIRWQYKLPPFGGTDGRIIERTRAGVVTGVISVPCRYIHSPFSMLRLDDFEGTVRLTTAFARRCGEV
jgi:endoglucanase